MKILIAEDEKPQAELLASRLKDYDPAINIVAITDSIESTVLFLSNCAEKTPDLMFLDVTLKDGLCFEVFDQVKTACPVIFTTSNTQYSLDAFYANGIHYLVKPITKERLREGMEKYHSLKGSFEQMKDPMVAPSTKNRNKIIFKSGHKSLPISVDDIAYIFVKEGLTYLTTKHDQRSMIDQNLDELITMLPPRTFIRLNRQYIAHIDAVKSFGPYTKGRIKVNLMPPLEGPVLVSYQNRTIFLDWMKQFT